MTAPGYAADDIGVDPLFEGRDVEFVASAGEGDGAANVDDLREVDAARLLVLSVG
jgi:hypothetical protein